MNEKNPHQGVGIIGLGHVGKALQQIFPEAVVFDKFLPNYDNSRGQINSCKLGIICVPTPMNSSDGSCDISAIEDVLSWLETPLILIKSTIPPGTTDRLKQKFNKRITFSPEYFGESSYWRSENFTAQGWPYIIVGGDHEDTSEIISIFAPRLGPDKIYRKTDSRTAELTKYMENAWLACQVIFATEFSELAKTFGVDYTELRELWALDPRVSKWHTLVFPDDRGFGGKCLPKDLEAIIAAASKMGYPPIFLKEISISNTRLRSGSLEKNLRP